ncbi:hypothetical protein [Bradyrhizobium sp. LHD-71]|uniref:hypothetical protein n=1 Tax=Bradyrhizobium sp. LHD-71 TaxID=3072141 RepID=UPI0028104C39|nr:hypothetical protein [Bradyrhizobium sp. LHD-71]MDQ8726248.1 hypothetical protein [Bradyrhizobium sp. LHD-71]
MISINSKLAVILGVAGAIALSAPSAEARTKRTSAKAHNAASSAPVVRQPSFRATYGFVPGPAGGGINFNDGRNGANYNPNQ